MLTGFDDILLRTSDRVVLLRSLGRRRPVIDRISAEKFVRRFCGRHQLLLAQNLRLSCLGLKLLELSLGHFRQLSLIHVQ